MKKLVVTLMLGCLISFQLTSCSDDDSGKKGGSDDDIIAEDNFIRAADISFLPEIEQEGTVTFKNREGVGENPLVTLKNAGCNTIRMRLWNNPATPHSGMAEVKILSQRVKAAGMKVWLTVHYSDTWADPGNQEKPQEWEGLDFESLKNAAKQYTVQVLNEIEPDIIQIGNETNSGFIYPEGNLVNNESGYLELVNTISETIREEAPGTKIMLHYAGIGNSADWFFNKVANVDYDYIGLSYYPIWHGKDLTALKNKMESLSQAHNKQIVIAETAYPFTLQWNDWTNNIYGQEDQLVPGYPATPEGQKAFLLKIREITASVSKGAGFAYWAPEWIAYRGNEATNGSTFENCAFWDFDNKALPVLEAYKKDL
jgi:arabinogalactan endo-1,4-beta-galactosidase